MNDGVGVAHEIEAYRREKNLAVIWAPAGLSRAADEEEQLAATKSAATHAAARLGASGGAASPEDRGEALHLQMERSVLEEAARINLTNLSEQDRALIHSERAQWTEEESRRLAVLFACAARCATPHKLGMIDPNVDMAEWGEIKHSDAQKSALARRSAEERVELVTGMPDIGASMRVPPAEPREFGTRPPLIDSFITAPTPLRFPLNEIGVRLLSPQTLPHKLIHAVKGGGKGRDGARAGCAASVSYTKRQVPFFMTNVFPLRHSLAARGGMHPAFLDPKSPTGMAAEVLAETATEMARCDPRTLEFVEQQRVRQVNATLTLDDPQNALAFQRVLEHMTQRAAMRYIDFVLVLRHGQNNIATAGRESAQQLDEDMARAAGIPATTTLAFCSPAWAAHAREFSKAMQARIVEVGQTRATRAREAVRIGLREELEARADNDVVAAECLKDSQLYERLADARYEELFPALTGPYARARPAGEEFNEVLLAAPLTRSSPWSLVLDHLAGYLDAIAGTGVDYYLCVRSLRGNCRIYESSNHGHLEQRVGMPRADKLCWIKEIKRLGRAVKHANQRVPKAETMRMHAMVATNDAPLLCTFAKKRVPRTCTSMEHVLFAGSKDEQRHVFYDRRVGRDDGPLQCTGYFNCLGRLFAHIPPLDLRQTELLAFATLWSPKGRDYLLPGRMDARRVMFGDAAMKAPAAAASSAT